MMTTLRKYKRETHLDDPDTNNATYIGWSDWNDNTYWPADYLIPKKREYYRQLDRYNSGLQNGPAWQNKRYQTFCLAREEVFNLGNRLGMKKWQRDRASRLLNGETRSELGLESTLVLISLLGYVLHDSRDERKCHPQTKDEDFDDEVDQMLRELSISRSNYDKTYRKIQRIDKRNDKKPTKVRDEYEMDLRSSQRMKEVEIGKGDGGL